MLIFKKMCEDSGYELSGDAESALYTLISDKYNSKDDNFANAREVRNVFEKVLVNHANRLAKLVNISTSDLSQIEATDISV